MAKRTHSENYLINPKARKFIKKEKNYLFEKLLIWHQPNDCFHSYVQPRKTAPPDSSLLPKLKCCGHAGSIVHPTHELMYRIARESRRFSISKCKKNVLLESRNQKSRLRQDRFYLTPQTLSLRSDSVRITDCSKCVTKNDKCFIFSTSFLPCNCSFSQYDRMLCLCTETHWAS